MSNMQRFEPQQGEVPNQEALAPMRTLTAEELVEVVGGPIIENGGGGIGITTNATSGTGG